MIELYRDFLIHRHERGLERERPLCVELDTHYSLVQYGGGNVVHFKFDKGDAQGRRDGDEEAGDLDKDLDGITPDEPQGDRIDLARLCGRSMLIADRDKGKEGRHKMFTDLLGDRFVRLGVRELENIFPPSILRAWVAKREKKQVHDIPAPDFVKYRDKYLGDYIENELLTGQDHAKYYSPNAKKAAKEEAYAMPLRSNLKDEYCSFAISTLSNRELHDSGQHQGAFDYLFENPEVEREVGSPTSELGRLGARMYGFVVERNG